MKLSAIDALQSFALLGPGFGDGFTLVTPLRARADGCVVFVPYEATTPQRFDGEVRIIELERDVAPAKLSVELDESGHREGVEAIRAAIAAGDVYQVNLTLRARLGAVSGAELFATLCRRSVPRFAAWVRFPDGGEIVSASPELFFAIDGERIRCEPMKGTAAPSAAESLAHSRKEGAELAMITDLIRNDLTPICVPRSVRVVCERRFIELPYAIQTVSDVEGQLLPDASLAANERSENGASPPATGGRWRKGGSSPSAESHDTIKQILQALHPGGSITGAPKHAAMTMIQSLERSPRGAYCGTLGYVEGERAVFSLLIRTASRDATEWVYGVGGGIVWDSDAERELDEARLKLGALR